MRNKVWGLAVKGIVRDEQGRILLLRRSGENALFVGAWEWPGGKVDAGEDYATALLREVFEETGLTVEITEFAGSNCFEMPKTRVVMLFFETHITAGSMQLSSEHDAFEWVDINELANWKLAENASEFMLRCKLTCSKKTPE